MTRTRIRALMHPWAETTPHDHPAEGCTAIHVHADDPCAVESCGKPLRADQSCYAVIELPREGRGRQNWVCWRHVQPDKGPQWLKAR